jgi:hypothetical protein
MSLWKRVIFSLIAGLIGGSLVAYASPGDFGSGLLGASALTALCVFGLISTWHWAGGGRTLAWMITLAFVLRLGVGIIMTVGLPLWGYDTPQQKSGYIFTDAFKRDAQTWELGTHGESLLVGFEKGFYADQYGGMLAIGGGIYRYFSPDAHRPIMVIIFGAFVAALGVVFLYKAIQLRWSEHLAALATWIMVFYPDSILFGASQLREPILIGLMCIAFWGVLAWKERRGPALAALIISFAFLAMFSTMITTTLFIMLAVLFWFEYIAPLSALWKRIGQVGMVIGSVLLLIFFWQWLNSAANWDILVTQMSSGWIAKIIEEAGAHFRWPIIAIYGLVQPVLPAAITDIDTRPVWYVVAVLRATGWYLLAPLLIYSVITLWSKHDVDQKQMLVWISIFVVVWSLIAAVRAGGDQWDNPRYRVIFIPWLGLLAAWGVDWAWRKRDAWLVRWVLVEFIFLGFFTNWYFSRYFHFGERLNFWVNVLCIVVLSVLVLCSGWIWNFARGVWAKKQKQ